MSERPLVQVSTPEGLAELIEALRGEPRVACDTEANSFHAYRERVCLVQLATPATDWILDPLAVDISPLGELFSDPEREVIFHAAEYDVLMLKRDYGFTFSALFDTQAAAMVLGCGQVSYAGLVDTRMGVHVPKGQQRSDWGRRPLSQAQVQYAAEDTRWLIALRDQLAAELTERKRWPDAEAAFRRLAAVEPRDRVFDPEAYRRMKGFRELDPQGRAVVRSLYLAREKRAEALDRPPFKVLGNDAILRIAQARPRDREGLLAIRGVPAQAKARWADDMLAAVHQGLSDPRPPSAEGPRGRSSRGQGNGSGRNWEPELRDRYERLRVWRNRTADARGVASPVIARNSTLEAIARANPHDLDALRAVQGVDRHAVETFGQEMLDVLRA